MDSTGKFGQWSVGRRQFLQASGAAALSLALSRLEAAEGKLPRRKLGSTGLEVSVISLGACDDARIINHALDLGINLLHTSSGYKEGRCVAAVGEVLRARRDEVIVMVQDSPRSNRFDGVLRRLQTDHVDVVVPPLEPRADNDARLKAAFEQKQKEGKVRFLGYAAHEQMSGVISCRAAAPFTTGMINYNLGVRAELDPVMRQAAEKAQIGFVAMKGTRGLDKKDTEAWQAGLRNLLQNNDLASIIIGMPSWQQLELNVNAVQQRNARADAAFAHYAALNADRFCAFCGTCQQACPQRLALMDYRRAELYAERGDQELADELLATIPAERSRLACTDCGHCARACPRRLDVRSCLNA